MLSVQREEVSQQREQNAAHEQDIHDTVRVLVYLFNNCNTVLVSER